MCGTSLKFEAHDNYVCFDCYCAMDLLRHEEEVQKKTSDDEFEKMRETAIELTYEEE